MIILSLFQFELIHIICFLDLFGLCSTHGHQISQVQGRVYQVGRHARKDPARNRNLQPEGKTAPKGKGNPQLTNRHPEQRNLHPQNSTPLNSIQRLSEYVKIEGLGIQRQIIS